MAIEQFEGIPTDSIIVVTDPATSGSDRGNMGWLRSLPYLRRQGVTTYTFSPSWLRYGSDVTFDEVMNEYDSGFSYIAIPGVDFEYRLIERADGHEDVSAQHLCQYTSRDTESGGSSSTTHKILNAYNRGRIDELVLVIDSPKFQIIKREAQKPLTETLDNFSELSYPGIAKQYLQAELDDRYLGYNETLNIWLHEAAVEYVNVMETEPSRIADLFEFNELEPGIRTWDVFEFLASETTKEEKDHIQATVRPWVERDISIIYSHILSALQEFEFDADQVREYRNGDH